MTKRIIIIMDREWPTTTHNNAKECHQHKTWGKGVNAYKYKECASYGFKKRTWVWWHIPMILAMGKLRRVHVESLKSPWATEWNVSLPQYPPGMNALCWHDKGNHWRNIYRRITWGSWWIVDSNLERLGCELKHPISNVAANGASWWTT